MRIPFLDRFRQNGQVVPVLEDRTPLENSLQREIARLHQIIQVKEEEIARLRADVKILHLDREVAQHHVSLLSDVIERERKRVEAEIAIAARRIVRAEQGEE